MHIILSYTAHHFLLEKALKLVLEHVLSNVIKSDIRLERLKWVEFFFEYLNGFQNYFCEQYDEDKILFWCQLPFGKSN